MQKSKDVVEVLLGPVLGFLRSQEEKWCMSAILATVAPTQETVLIAQNAASSETVAKVPGELIYRWRNTLVWRFLFRVPILDHDVKYKYTVLGTPTAYEFEVPKAGSLPTVFFATCNGENDWKKPIYFEGMDKLWVAAKDEHQKQPYHLMLLGGDNVYLDSLFKFLPSLKEFSEDGIKSSGLEKVEWSTQMEEEAKDYIMKVYTQTWGRSDQAYMFSHVPNMMMWDDHDIIDGYGNYPDEKRNSSFMKGLFKVASEFFWVFQMQGNTGNLLFQPSSPWTMGDTVPHPLTHYSRAGSTGILSLDLRSERTMTQVLSETTMGRLQKLLHSFSGLTHLIVVLPMPLVFAKIEDLEKLVNKLHISASDIDDLRDTFSSKPHRQVKEDLLQMLFDLSDRSGTQVFILAGDTHIGALFRFRSKDHNSVIYQPVSSGICAQPTTRLIRTGLTGLAADAPLNLTEKKFKFHLISLPDKDAYGLAMLQKKKKFIWKQNFLSLLPQPGNPQQACYTAIFTSGHNCGPKSKRPIQHYAHKMERTSPTDDA